VTGGDERKQKILAALGRTSRKIDAERREIEKLRVEHANLNEIMRNSQAKEDDIVAKQIRSQERKEEAQKKREDKERIKEQNKAVREAKRLAK
jgi:hypothetical protein